MAWRPFFAPLPAIRGHAFPPQAWRPALVIHDVVACYRYRQSWRTALSVVAICCIHGVIICRTIRFSPNHSMRSAPCLSVIAGRRPAGIGRTGMHPVSSSHAVRCAGRRIYNHCKIFVKFNRYLCKYFQLWETRTHKSTFTQFSP